MDERQFKTLPLIEVNRVYWEEILYRIHWAAIANSIRHLRWFDACVTHMTTQPNYLAFCAALRGLIESAADTTYSLNNIPLTIASAADKIIDALNGTLDNSFVISQDIEDRLIHFLHARKLDREERVPTTHRAETAAKYVNALEHPDYKVKALYSELCQIVHPAEASLHWLSHLDKDGWKVGRQDDIGTINKLICAYETTISWIQQNSGNIIILLCQVLNTLPLKKLHVEAVNKWRLNSTPLYKKIENEFKLHGILWPK